MTKVFFKTFGCRTNIYDTELLKSYVKDYEVTNNEQEASIVVINSCTVTNNADLDLKAYIKKLKKNDIRVILTGCASKNSKNLLDEGLVFGIFGMSNKSKINEFLASKKTFNDLGNLNFIDKDLVANYQNHTKAFVKIQEGCDFSCSYCIIPSVRGKSRSMQASKILEQIKLLTQNGYGEIVLTGTNIGSYKTKDIKNLAELLAEILKIPKLKRLRLGSLEPSQIDRNFLELLDNEILAKHLHIALQHTNKAMLKLMKRPSKLEKNLELFSYLASKGYALGTDFIVAHPGETQELFDDALANFIKFKLSHLHSFIYSARLNTLSASMLNTTDKATAKQRQQKLKEIVRLNNFKFRLNKEKEKLLILVENYKDGFYEGYDQFFNKIKIKSNKNLTKTWLELNTHQVKEEGNFASI